MLIMSCKAQRIRWWTKYVHYQGSYILAVAKKIKVEQNDRKRERSIETVRKWHIANDTPVLSSFELYFNGLRVGWS